MCLVLQKKDVKAEASVSSPGGGTQNQLQPVNFKKLLLTR
jgi:hypothetical protein